ncbi:MAG: DMT family transporter [Candidatus Woykebacteria bacterium]
MNRFVLVLLTGLAFGTSVVITRFAISEIPPLPQVGFRLLIASLAFLFTFFILKGKPPSQGRQRLDIALIGVFGAAVPLLTLTTALQFVSSGMLTIFIAMSPLATALVAHFLLSDERLKAAKIIGLLLATSGVLFLIFTNTSGIPKVTLDIRGPLLSLIGVVAIAFSTVYTRARLKEVRPLVVSTWQTLAGALVVAPFAFWLVRPDLSLVTWKGWLAVTYNGLVGSFIAFWLTFTIIKRYGATSSVLPTYLMPAVAGIFGTVLLGELITFPLLIGAVIILAGVFLAKK